MRNLLTLLLLLIFQSSHAQVQVTSHVMPTYLNRVQDYASHPELMVVTVTNTSTSLQELQLTAKITGDNGISAWVKPGYRSPSAITLQPGQSKILNGNDIALLFDINKIEYTGISRGDMNRGLGLLEGNYTLCIRALDYKTLEPISSPAPLGCTSFRISDLEPPRIIMPLNKQEIPGKATQALPITWTTPPSSPPGTQYKVKLVEMIASRNPNDAIQTTTPLYEGVTNTNMLLYGPDKPALVSGREYALVVQAIDPSQRSNFRNNGISEVRTFIYGSNNDLPSNLTPNLPQNMVVKASPLGLTPDCGCKIQLPSGGKAVNLLSSGMRVLVNNFEMQVNTVTSSNNGFFTGTGVIALQNLGAAGKVVRLRVSFEDIKINEFNNGQLRLVDGFVRGITRSNFGLMPNQDNPNLSTIPLTSDKARQIDQYFKDNKDQLVSNMEKSIQSTGFELPFGVDKGVYSLGITSVVFNPFQSWFEAVSVVDISEANLKIAFSARGVCMNDSGLCGDIALHLSEDARLGITGLLLKGGDDGTQMLFNKEGFQKLKIAAQYTFPNTFPLLEAETGNPLMASIVGETNKGWNKWIGSAQLAPFQIGNNNDFVFGSAQGTTVIYDHSDVDNSDIIGKPMPARFESGDPADAPLIIDKTWTGFYIPEIALKLPNGLNHIGGQRLEIVAKDLIFDEGITGKLAAKNVVSLSDGSLDGWFFSVDEIGLNFWKNSFKQSYMKGKLVLPASGDDISSKNQIDYSCTLTKPQGQNIQFELSAKPKNNLEFSAFWTTLTVESASRISVKTESATGINARAVLHGKMVFKTNIKHLPDLTLGEVKFQNMEIGSQEPYFKPGQIDIHTGEDRMAFNEHFSDLPTYAYQEDKGPSNSFDNSKNNFFAASSGSSVVGFSLSETRVSPYISGGNFGFRFGGSLQLVKGVNFIPKASAQFAIYASVSDLATGKRKFWKSVRGKLESVELEAEAKLGPVSVKGSVNYVSIDNGNFQDNALKGALSITLPASMGAIDMQALFGSRKVENGKQFYYFYTDASIEIQSPGITLFPGTALYGFAGGFYYNMNVVQATKVDTKQQESAPETLSFTESVPESVNPENDPPVVKIVSFSGNTYTPRDINTPGNSFGIMAGVYFGLANKNTLEGLLALDIAFNTSSGFSHFWLDGKANIMSSTGGSFKERRESSVATAFLALKVNTFDSPGGKNGEKAIGSFKDFSFEAGYKLKYPVKNPIVTSSGWLSFYINYEPKWHFKMGSPSNPCSIEFLKFLEAKSYFQVGNHEIEGIPPVPAKILEILGTKSVTHEDPANNSLDNAPVAIPGGGRNATNMNNGKGLNFGARVELNANPKFLIFYADLYAGLGFDVSLEQLEKANASCGQGTGSWYARGQAFVGAKGGFGVNVNLFGLKKKIEFINAGMAAVMSMGGPTPLYASGILAGKFSILGGIISGRFGIRANFGTACPDQASRELSLISEINPGEKQVNLYERPQVTFNYPLNKDFVVALTTLDNDGNITGVKYDVFRFRMNYVDIKVLENGRQIYGSNDFSFPGIGVNSPQNQISYYYKNYSRGMYVLKLKQGLPILNRKSNYEVKVDAKVKVMTINNAGIQFNESTANQMAAMNWGEGAFVFVKKDNSNVEYVDHQDTTFTTNNGPKQLPLALLKNILPVHRHKGVPYRSLPNNTGFVELESAFPIDRYDTELENPQLMARIVTASENENDRKTDVPVMISDGGKRYNFQMPSLLPNKPYVIRLFLKGKLPESNSNNASDTRLKAIERLKNLSSKNDFQINNRVINEAVLKMDASEHEIFSWYFNTGLYPGYKDKYQDLKMENLLVYNNDGSNIVLNANSTEIEWSKFIDLETDSIKVSGVGLQKEYYGPEFFNSLDVNTKNIGSIFPNVGTPNMKLLLGASGYNDIEIKPENLMNADSLLQQMVDGSLITGHDINLIYPGSHKDKLGNVYGNAEVFSYTYITDILAANLYGITYENNDYIGNSIPAPASTSGNKVAFVPILTNEINSIIANSGIKLGTEKIEDFIRNAPLDPNTPPTNQHVMSSQRNLTHQPGRDLVNFSNHIGDYINRKKNLGYPPVMISRLGMVMDSMAKMLNPASIQFNNVNGKSGQTIIMR